MSVGPMQFGVTNNAGTDGTSLTSSSISALKVQATSIGTAIEGIAQETGITARAQNLGVGGFSPGDIGTGVLGGLRRCRRGKRCSSGCWRTWEC